MMFWYNGGWGWWQMTLMWVGMIVFWGLIIWAVYALIAGLTRGSRPRGGDHDQGSDARRILDERLARGEIDIEQYRQLRETLTGTSEDVSAGARPGSREPTDAGSRR